ncbi:hypothetical protein DUNSADRAFT_2725 [Dunaliella salina]|uniref:Uncharacterized protein n=1 Tax=Dunaliella salina TaxID=3046 RepID=A0ABQ7GVF2_DUNSA|nr:hypothetical protein DUNSADRAFT_2725 [Dunaliella salina]|eukprot:KAF5838527.1 hypothetical protein DUNSADRAFT_2725 [Dunaliella salina]
MVPRLKPFTPYRKDLADALSESYEEDFANALSKSHSKGLAGASKVWQPSTRRACRMPACLSARYTCSRGLCVGCACV